MSQDSFFHEASGAVRFWVEIGTEWIGASVGKESLHFKYHPHGRDDDPLETYRTHMVELDEAVRRRFAEGSREPVMLREADLAA